MVLYIIRGIPGSGKSEIAKRICPEHNYSATDFYYNKKGEFNYDVTKLDNVHRKCYEAVQNAMYQGVDEIAVHNTFVKKWEYQGYVDMALKLGYECKEIICRGNTISKYNIPSEKVQRMLQEFEY